MTRAPRPRQRAGTGRAAGFTLLEILVVVFLIGILSAVLTASIGGGFGVHLRNAGRTLSAELEYVSQRAVTTGRVQRFVLDLDEQLFRVEELPPPVAAADPELPEHAEGLDLAPPPEAREFVPVDGRIGEWRALDDDEVLFAEVKLADDTKREGAVAIGFAPDGGSDPAEVLLVDDGGYALRLRLVAFSGEIRVEDVDLAAP